MKNELLFQIALTMIPQIGDVHSRLLINKFKTASEIFRAPRSHLEKIEGIGSVRAGGIKSFKDFNRCEKEISFIEKFNISPIFFTEPHYPGRLNNCYDSPALIYYKGTANLNATRILSVVGTRLPTQYGKQFCESIIFGLPSDILVISGLAFGIDTLCHKAALKNNLQTIGVLAHGLDRIYPRENRGLAKQMVENGGLLTDYCSATNPDRENFPKRNRIVAGIADAVLVIETGIKGGSMITADLANGYNKDVFALPGRIIDKKSDGCNALIKQNKAMLVTSAEDILETMNWFQEKQSKKIQPEIFMELSAEEKLIANILEAGEKGFDELSTCGLKPGALSAVLLNLELNGIIGSLPGKRYQWLRNC